MVTPNSNDAGPGPIPAAGRERIVLRRVLTWAVAVPLTLMAVLAATLFGQIQSLLEADDWVEHTNHVIDRAHHVQQLVVDMQAGMRGYLLTGGPNFLHPYTAAEAAVDVAFNDLGRLVADNSAQTGSLNELRGAYAQWHLHARETIALRRGGEEGLQEITLTTRDKAMMDVLRARFATFIAVESGLRGRRSEAVREAADFATNSVLVATVLLGGIIAFVARHQLIHLSRSYEDALAVERWTLTKLVESSDALWANEERFQAFMDNTPAVAFIKDAEGRYLYVNKRWDHLFRVKYGDLLGKTDFEVWPEALARQFCESDQAALATGQTREELQSILASNGETRYWMTLKFPIRDAAGKVLLAGMSIDVTGRKRAAKRIKGLNRQLRRRLERIAALRRIDTAITASLDLRHTLDVCLEQACAQLRVDAADILVCCPHTHDLTYAAGKGFRTPGVHLTRLRLACRGVGQVILERHPLHIADLGQSSETFDRSALFTAEEFVAYHAIPLIAKGQVRGVLEVFHRMPVDPDLEWLDFLETVASQVAIAIDNATMFDNLQRSHTALVLAYDATIEGWAAALDLRDKETEGHTRRVTEMTLRLAQAMGVDPAEQAHMRRGALLHDVGKLGIPDAILLKPGKLTEEEWQVMRRHPQHAYNWLAPIDFLRPALDIPYGHHEKWDGTGYPRGLKGEQIPRAARIFAAVDIWDALRSDRPYREGWPEERVCEHLLSLAGTHLDAAVVEVFLEVLAADAAGEPDGGPCEFAEGMGLDTAGEVNVSRPVAVKVLEGRLAEQLRRADASNRQWEALRVELERDNARLVEQATTDDLTGLKNLRYFHEALEAAFSFALRQEQPLSVALLDVDDFEPYKEAHGHAAGDDLLNAVARILREHVRAHDVVAHHGGDEFAILLPSADADAARAVVERLQTAIAERGWPHRPVTASVGMATMPPFVLSASDLVERADWALTHAKRRGHGQFAHHDKDEVLPVT